MDARILVACFMAVLIGCSETKKETELNPTDTATNLIDESVKAHGGSAYEKANLAFDFRERSYTLKHEGGTFIYTSHYQKQGDTYDDVLDNNGFSRTVNEVAVELHDSNAIKYANSLNSVIYFAMLPYKLQDPAVIKIDHGSTRIGSQEYAVVEIRFTEEGGGTDHDDIFYYWINKENKYVDFLAYSYSVDGGGVRFRSAHNHRVVEGIHFQDYINYKAAIGTDLSDLPGQYEKGELKELSRIELKNIKAL